MSKPIIEIEKLSKIYEGGFQALNTINLEINEGEIFALLGPNGAGKTTLIGSVCGLNMPTSGSVKVAGYDIQKDFRKTRQLIGLVPQELTTDAFETVSQTVQFSRGLFGKSKNKKIVADLLESLTLTEKSSNKLMTLSGGMKRRVMIAKALAHEPRVLFLDEPTAGVDVELRKDMWEQVRRLREKGVTIILTTHYIEEAEEMADRVGVINKGEIILVDDKTNLMKNLGTKQLVLSLSQPLPEDSELLNSPDIKQDGEKIIYTYDDKKSENGINKLLADIQGQSRMIQDITTKQSSLEEIFVNLVKNK